MAQQIQLRGGPSTEWNNVNPILAQREVGVDTTTNGIKIGDGVTPWNSLPYFSTLDPSIVATLSALQSDPRFSISRLVLVKKNPGAGEFGTILSALNFVSAATDRNEENHYVIAVGPGTYTETQELVVPSFCHVRGSTIQSTIVRPFGTHHIFKMSQYSELSFMTISDAAVGFAGIACVDSGDFTQVHKVSMYDNDTNILLQSSTTDSVIYLEYVDINGSYSKGVSVISQNGFKAKCNAENFYSFSTVGQVGPHITVNGSAASVDLISSGLNGDGTNKLILMENGSSLLTSSVYLRDADMGIHFSNVGLPSDGIMSSTNFKNCNWNLNAEHPDTTGTFTGYSVYEKNYIHPTSQFFITGKDTNIISVAKRGGDFDTVKEAMDSITSSSATKTYEIQVGPGIFVEESIVFRPYVFVRGSGDGVTVIQASNPNDHLIKAVPRSGISKLTLTGATGTGKSLIYLSSTLLTTATEVFSVRSVTFGSADILAYAEGTLNGAASNIYIGESTVGGTYSYRVGLLAKTTTGNSARVLMRASNTQGAVTPFPETFAAAEGVGSEIVLNSVQARNGSPTGSALKVNDGGRLRVTGVNIRNWAKGLYSENIGTANTIKATAISFEDCATDVHIEHPGTIGNINGTAESTKVLVDPLSTIAIFFTDPQAGGIVSHGKVFLGRTHSTITDIAPLLAGTTTMGIVTGGSLTASSGLNVLVGQGLGYVSVGSFPTKDLKKMEWGPATVALPANSSVYVYVNSDGVFSTSATFPSNTSNLIFGRVATNSTGIEFIDASPNVSLHATNSQLVFNRRALGAVYESGSIVSAYGTNRGISVSPGSYFFSIHNFKPSGGVGIQFTSYNRNGSGGYNRNLATVVDNTVWDNDSTTTNLTAGYYVKHSLYVVGQGANEKYFLVHSQAEFSALTLAEQGPLPAAPTYFEDGVVLIASIITQQGNNSIVQIRDERPVIGFKSSGVSASTTHGNLLGLAADDHPQYLLANGNRPMAGSLNMGSNNITNVGTVKGIDVTAHASRHLPNGADPLTTGTPITIGTTNSVGVANELARSDHKHAHGDLPGGTLHELATATVDGFMSSTMVSKLSGIASGATANSTDAQLRDRATHTGSITSSVVSDFSTTVRATPVTGVVASDAVIAATDSVLTAIGKAQGQLNTLKAIPPKVFGDNYAVSVSLAAATNTSATAFITKTSLVIPTLPAGDYLLKANYKATTSTNGRSATIILSDGTTTLASDEPYWGSNLDRGFRGVEVVLQNTTGGKTYSIAFRAGSPAIATSSTITLSDVTLTFWRLK